MLNDFPFGEEWLTSDDRANHANNQEKVMTTPKLSFGTWRFATAFLVLLTSQSSSAFPQHLREWQSKAGTTVVAQVVRQTAGTVQLIDSNGKEYSLALEKLSEVDRRYLKLQELIQSDGRQFEAVVNLSDAIKTTPQATIEMTVKLAKDYPDSPYASLWAGVATAVALNDTDRATIHFRDASRRIREQQKTDPNRHRRTLVSSHINLAVCFLKKKDAEHWRPIGGLIS